MSFIAWIVSSLALAWAASLLTRADRQFGLTLSVLLGMLGGAVGHWILQPAATLPAMGLQAAHAPVLTSLLTTFFSALVLLAALSLVRKSGSAFAHFRAGRYIKRTTDAQA